MYHRVLSGEELTRYSYQTGMTVSIDTFRMQMEYISRHCRPVSLGDFTDHLQRNVPFETMTVLVTFDDGWRDNFVNAYPILKERQIPAVIFLPTDYIDSNRHFWQQELAEIILAIRNKALKNDEWWRARAEVLDHIVHKAVTSSEEGLTLALANLLNDQKKKTINQIQKLIESLRRAFDDTEKHSDKADTFLTWDEVRTMAYDGIEFGSHGKNHSLLTVISNKEAEQEISGSKTDAEKHIGEQIKAFSYPNGNYNDAVMNLVKQEGYLLAFGTAPGIVSSDDDRYSIKRINVHEDMTNTLPMFLARIAGLS